MSSDAQINANQINSKLSTGPVTAEGKAASSQNNFRHGFRGAFSLHPDEDPKEYAALRDGLHAEYKPATLTEELLVEQMAQHEWRNRRIQFLLDGLTFNPSYVNAHEVSLWMRYQSSFSRGFHKCLADLLKLRAERRKEQIGFERQRITAAAEARQKQLADARIRLVNAQTAACEQRAQRQSKAQNTFTDSNRTLQSVSTHAAAAANPQISALL